MTFLLKFSFLSGPRSRFRPAAARSSSSRSAASPQAPATSAALFFLLLWRREPGPFSSGCPTPCLPAPSPPHPGRWQPELTRIRRPSRSAPSARRCRDRWSPLRCGGKLIRLRQRRELGLPFLRRSASCALPPRGPAAGCTRRRGLACADLHTAVQKLRRRPASPAAACRGGLAAPPSTARGAAASPTPVCASQVSSSAAARPHLRPPAHRGSAVPPPTARGAAALRPRNRLCAIEGLRRPVANRQPSSTRSSVLASRGRARSSGTQHTSGSVFKPISASHASVEFFLPSLSSTPAEIRRQLADVPPLEEALGSGSDADIPLQTLVMSCGFRQPLFSAVLSDERGKLQ
uniref:Uncharacterized protein n=1 Tax=Setaria viridis TaxID=4556 RepID=A0A4U6UZA7_SETVI|nr:hypothetical protein SEVIR_4G206201v2 [Setaria viridis]